MAVIGSFLGWQGVFGSFFVACLAGSVYGIIHLLVTRDRYLAFGPFLSVGALLMMLFPKAFYAALDWWQGLVQSWTKALMG